jgi:hypothetical protein
MIANRDDLLAWFERGVAGDNTHMIIVCDTFDYDDYPVYEMGHADTVRKKVEVINSKNMQKVMEVYDLSKDMDKQLDQRHCFNY